MNYQVKGSEGPNKRTRDRSVEYDKEKVVKAIRSRPDTKEAEVLKELLKCRNQVMLAKTQEFLNEFKEQGFG